MSELSRRELFQLIATLTGTAFVPPAVLAAGGEAHPATAYSDADLRLLDEVAETILPRTDTPGAKDAGVGAFIATYSAGRYSLRDLAIVKAGIVEIEARMQAAHGVPFVAATPERKRALLVEIDRDAKRFVPAADPGHPDAQHYFTLLKHLTLFGFFTSELGAAHAARYSPIPGKYQGCIPYKGETFWAW